MPLTRPSASKVPNQISGCAPSETARSEGPSLAKDGSPLLVCHVFCCLVRICDCGCV